jgi:hypothetical protein
MTDIELLPVGSMCHAVMYAVDDPEILFPVKVEITSADIGSNFMLPSYNVRIVWFYDNILFLRSNLANCSLRLKSGANRIIKVSMKHFKTQESISEFFANSAERYKIEHFFVRKRRIDMEELFTKLQRYLINNQLRKLATSMNRKTYGDNGGEFYVVNRSEFLERLRRGFGDKFKDDESFKRYTSYLYGV